ncbi:MAG TPA: tagatose 1,6-diphosphate aldolase [Dehalococcoidia bacterium]|jgi:tagatose 1,6-diphosphate aldolase
MTTRITKGKFDGITALADERGVINAVAVDQREWLTKAIEKAHGGEYQTTSDDLTQFKIAVAEVLTKYASGILLDPEYGLPAIQHKSPSAGVLLAYEQSGYDQTAEGRLPKLLPQWTVSRLADAGADAVKILLYYNPFDKKQINTIKHDFVERVGTECATSDVAFFLELVTYDDALGDVQGIDYARGKPEHVTRAMEEFSKPKYGVDVLKVEVPVNLTFVEGARAFGGTVAYTRSDAMRLFREAASVAAKPFIYLSAGVSDTVFLETLELAAEAGTRFSGVLCGRAGWQGGVPAFATGGPAAFTAWLADQGVSEITARNTILAAGATPWWTVYGGRENIEVAAARGVGRV